MVMSHAGRVMMDSGSNISILGAAGVPLISDLNLELLPCPNSLSTAAGASHQLQSCVQLPITVSGLTNVVEAVVCRDVPHWLIME